MTLKNRCVNCDHVIEAPDDMRGHEIACPNCESTNVLLSPDDARRRQAQDHVVTQRERRKFLRNLASNPRRVAGNWVAPIEAPLAQQDLALMAARRLKDISVYLLVFSYLLLVVALLLGAAIAVWTDLPGAWKAFAVGSGAFVGATVFIVFKYMSDTVRALADLTDLGRSLDERLSLVLQATENAARTGDMPTEDSAADEVLSQAG